jgi:hypothetical protein
VAQTHCGVELVNRKRIFADAVLAARRPYAMRFALNYPAPDAGRFDLKERRRLPRRQQFRVDPADRTGDQGGPHHDPLLLKSNDLDSSFDHCQARALMYNSGDR